MYNNDIRGWRNPVGSTLPNPKKREKKEIREENKMDITCGKYGIIFEDTFDHVLTYDDLEKMKKDYLEDDFLTVEDVVAHYINFDSYIRLFYPYICAYLQHELEADGVKNIRLEEN